MYIEGADYSPDFMSHLVVFALKLRNQGYDDHGLVVHLSDMIAGNVYGFGTQVVPGYFMVPRAIAPYTKKRKPTSWP